MAPPHLPCGAPKAGATEELMPNIGWVSAVPDGRATVKFDIAGTTLAFSGVGYHDKVRYAQTLANNTILLLGLLC